MPRRFHSQCVACSWRSRLYNGPAMAGFAALWHVKDHPDLDGLIAIIYEVVGMGELPFEKSRYPNLNRVKGD